MLIRNRPLKLTVLPCARWNPTAPWNGSDAKNCMCPGNSWCLISCQVGLPSNSCRQYCEFRAIEVPNNSFVQNSWSSLAVSMTKDEALHALDVDNEHISAKVPFWTKNTWNSLRETVYHSIPIKSGNITAPLKKSPLFSKFLPLDIWAQILLASVPNKSSTENFFVFQGASCFQQSAQLIPEVLGCDRDPIFTGGFWTRELPVTLPIFSYSHWRPL